jgi:SsrA-binding protein
MAAPKGTARHPAVSGPPVADNRRARFNYEILDTLEAGIMLTGTEVKALRTGKGNIGDSYASIEGGELWLINSYLPEYLQANRFNHEPRRRRKLLVNMRQLANLAKSVEREGMTLVPLKIYFNAKGRAKLELAVARGKKLHDKRETEKKRDWNREKARILKAG